MSMTPSYSLLGILGWIEIAVIGVVVLIVLGPRLLDYCARVAAERQRYR